MGWLFFYKIVRIVKFYKTDLSMMEFLVWTRRRLDKYSTKAYIMIIGLATALTLLEYLSS